MSTSASRNSTTETRLVSEMNATVNDAAALELVSPEAMVAFMETNGYREIREETREIDGTETVIGRHYRLPKGQETEFGGEWAAVCLYQGFDDYCLRVADFLRDMSCATGRNQLSLWFELAGVPTDGLPSIPARTDK
jgi:hypothetical protein